MLASLRRGAAKRALTTGLIALAALIGTPPAHAEENSASSEAAANSKAKPFRRYRWQEDYSYLADKPQRDEWEQIKYIALPGLPGVWLSLGGEVRYRLDGYSPYLFGIGKSGSIWASNQERMFSHFDLHLGQTFRAYVEFDAAHENGRPVQRAYDQSAPDLRQAFVDVVLPFGGGNAMLRAGREELYLGTTRWLAVRDPTNIRRSFDGFLAEYNDRMLTLRAFAAHPVNITPGCFDDNTLNSEFFRGAYAVVRNPFDLPVTIDAYVYGRQQASATYARGTAAEDRWSGGARLAASLRGFEMIGEAAYQWGSFGTSDISAYGAFGDFGYRFAPRDLLLRKVTPKIGVRAHYASGDDDLRSSTFRNFTAAYPAASVISEMSLLAVSNVESVQPYGQLFLPSGLVLGANWNFVRKVEVADSVYGPPGTLITAKGSTSRDVAQIAEVNMTWQINRFSQLHALYSHIYAGQYLRDAGGRDFDYYRLQFTAWW